MNFRLIPILIFLLASGLSVSALTITAPQKVVANSAWNFQAEFDFLDSFSTANVLLDSQKILTVQLSYQPAIDPQSDQLVLKANLVDKKLFVTLAGVSAGNHTVTIQTLDSAGAVLNSKDALVLGVEPVDSSLQADLQAKIDTLTSQLNSITQQLDAANQANASLQQTLSKQDSRLEEQSNALSNLAALVDVVRQNQAGSTTFSQTADQKLQDLQQKISDLQSQVDSASGATGLVGAGSFSWSIATILGLLILVGIAGFTVYRYTREKKVY